MNAAGHPCLLRRGPFATPPALTGAPNPATAFGASQAALLDSTEARCAAGGGPQTDSSQLTHIAAPRRSAREVWGQSEALGQRPVLVDRRPADRLRTLPLHCPKLRPSGLVR
jgi:hypothetical protein